MGVTGGAYDIIFNPLQKIHAELLDRAKQAQPADQKFLRKIAKQLNRNVISTITTSSTPPYASIYQWMAAIYTKITGQAANPNGSTYEDLITLEYAILQGLETAAGTKNGIPQMDPKSFGQNHRSLVYLEGIYQAVSYLADPSSSIVFSPMVPTTIEAQLVSPHHLAVAGYLDAIGQATAMWKNGTYTPPDPSTTNVSDAGWFVLYLKQIYATYPVVPG
jgi:hypothetical protein